jgi:DNA-3-methyladenine glycosylase II
MLSSNRMPLPIPLTEESLHEYALELARAEARFWLILEQLGPPPIWRREPGFPALVLIILEQQVSLASARAAYNRLLNICPVLTPKEFLALGDDALHMAGFSRQKTSYCRGLALAIIEGQLELQSLIGKDDDTVRQELISVKGIGAWTADIYLLMALRRPDIWPVLDRALAVAVQRLWKMTQAPSPAELAQMGEDWRPYRAVAARLLWHYYLNNGRLKNGRM